MTQQWVKLPRLIKDVIIVYNSSKAKSVAAEEKMLIGMRIWLGNKIKNGKIHNLITFQKGLKILLGQGASS